MSFTPICSGCVMCGHVGVRGAGRGRQGYHHPRGFHRGESSSLPLLTSHHHHAPSTPRLTRSLHACCATTGCSPSARLRRAADGPLAGLDVSALLLSQLFAEGDEPQPALHVPQRQPPQPGRRPTTRYAYPLNHSPPLTPTSVHNPVTFLCVPTA